MHILNLNTKQISKDTYNLNLNKDHHFIILKWWFYILEKLHNLPNI